MTPKSKENLHILNLPCEILQRIILFVDTESDFGAFASASQAFRHFYRDIGFWASWLLFRYGKREALARPYLYAPPTGVEPFDASDLVLELVRRGANVHIRQKVKRLHEFLEEVGETTQLEGRVDEYPFFYAVLTRNTRLLETILQSGGDMWPQKGFLIHFAALHGYADGVQLMVDSGQVDEELLQRALLISAAEGQSNVVDVLLDRMNDQTALDNALVIAARSGDLCVLKQLVARGANIHALNNEAMRTAKTAEIVQFLLEHGVNGVERRRLELLSNDDKVAKVLIRFGVDPAAGDQAALCYACYEGDIDRVQHIVNEATVDIHEGDDEALVWACKRGHPDVVKFLLQAGADPNGRDGLGLTMASRNRHSRVIDLLLSAGVRNASCTRSFIEASSNGIIEIVRLFLKRGANANASGGEALHLAALNGHVEVVKLLLDAGAKPRLRDSIALRQTKDLECARMLLKHGADVHAHTDFLLRRAVCGGDEAMVKLCLEFGADVHADSDFSIRTGAENGFERIVELLLQAGADFHTANDEALVRASARGHKRIVRILLEAGATFPDVDSDDECESRDGTESDIE
ncbi:hypothetical protein HK102_008152 [Quaeritorhiza haematococci]|nr:hypothetical protein HK102_008152 [Quaeritorhiza haematococci]